VHLVTFIAPKGLSVALQVQFVDSAIMDANWDIVAVELLLLLYLEQQQLPPLAREDIQRVQENILVVLLDYFVVVVRMDAKLGNAVPQPLHLRYPLPQELVTVFVARSVEALQFPVLVNVVALMLLQTLVLGAKKGMYVVGDKHQQHQNAA